MDYDKYVALTDKKDLTVWEICLASYKYMEKSLDEGTFSLDDDEEYICTLAGKLVNVLKELEPLEKAFGKPKKSRARHYYKY